MTYLYDSEYVDDLNLHMNRLNSLWMIAIKEKNGIIEFAEEHKFIDLTMDYCQSQNLDEDTKFIGPFYSKYCCRLYINSLNDR